MDCTQIAGSPTPDPRCFTNDLSDPIACDQDMGIGTTAMSTLLRQGKGTDGMNGSLCILPSFVTPSSVQMVPCGDGFQCVASSLGILKNTR